MLSPSVRKWLVRLLRAVGVFALLFLVAAVVFSLCSRPIKLLFTPTAEAARHPMRADGVAHYARDEVDTFYTYPEWYIVWSYQAKAGFQQTHLPSGYSYFGDIGQFWKAYSRMYAATRRVYPFAAGDHIMLAVIGSSLTVEYTLKGLYEETLGRVSERTSGRQMVAEDNYAAKVAQQYAAFVHVRPFYEFSFAHALRGLWSDTPFRTTHLIRTLERRAWLSLDYAVESAYCEAIELATHATYGYEDVNTAAWIEFPAPAKARVLASVRSMKVAKDLGATEAIVEIPRYQEFTADAQQLMRDGVRFHQISGNELILISAIAPSVWTNSSPNLQLLLSQPTLTDPSKTRVVLLGKVSDLHQILFPLLERQQLTIEHLYDY
jgi:hypothetical protein